MSQSPLQCICTAPPGIIRQWATRPDEEGNPGGGIPVLAQLPPAELMPGTRQYEGDAACHITYDGDLQELQDAFLPPMTVVAAQRYKLTYSDDGTVHGVEIPVPLDFVDFLPDIVEYDGTGKEIRRVRPTAPCPLHVFAGADPWVWEAAEQKVVQGEVVSEE